MSDDSGPRPNFFVVGAAKAGTTSLYAHLRAHPQIFMSPVKEPHYLAAEIDPREFSPDYRRNLPRDYAARLERNPDEPIHCAHIRCWDEYTALFRGAGGKLAIGEASNSYLGSPSAAQAIRSRFPDAKIVMVLRDPVARAWSDYLMSVRLGHAHASFREELQRDRARTEHRWGRDILYVENGLYHDKVRRYFELFGRDRVLVLLYEELCRDVAASMLRVHRFLGVRPEPVTSLPRLNSARVPRSVALNRMIVRTGIRELAWNRVPAPLRRALKAAWFSRASIPVLEDTDREYAATFFRDDVESLAHLLDRDLSGWLRRADVRTPTGQPLS